MPGGTVLACGIDSPLNFDTSEDQQTPIRLIQEFQPLNFKFYQNCFTKADTNSSWTGTVGNTYNSIHHI